ncbi:hypothetical protein [Neorhizobium galegae]|uniref:hypothetical protein n=1 Tax=Neorhizobium galegae TaxID=399 RepID=UPI00349EAB6A
MDTDFRVINFDLVDDGAQVSAAERDRAVCDVLPHQACEGINLLFCDPRFGAQFGEGAIKRCLGLVALVLERRNTVFQRRVGEIRHAAFYSAIQARKTAFGILDLVLKRRHPVRMVFGS